MRKALDNVANGDIDDTPKTAGTIVIVAVLTLVGLRYLFERK